MSVLHNAKPCSLTAFEMRKRRRSSVLGTAFCAKGKLRSRETESNEEGKDRCALRGVNVFSVFPPKPLAAPDMKHSSPKPAKNLVEKAEGHPLLHLHGLGLVGVRVAGALRCPSGGAC